MANFRENVLTKEQTGYRDSLHALVHVIRNPALRESQNFPFIFLFSQFLSDEDTDPLGCKRQNEFRATSVKRNFTLHRHSPAPFTVCNRFSGSRRPTEWYDFDESVTNPQSEISIQILGFYSKSPGRKDSIVRSLCPKISNSDNCLFSYSIDN